jgi:hypothetical protein
MLGFSIVIFSPHDLTFKLQRSDARHPLPHFLVLTFPSLLTMNPPRCTSLQEQSASLLLLSGDSKALLTVIPSHKGIAITPLPNLVDMFLALLQRDVHVSVHRLQLPCAQPRAMSAICHPIPFYSALPQTSELAQVPGRRGQYVN